MNSNKRRIYGSTRSRRDGLEIFLSLSTIERGGGGLEPYHANPHRPQNKDKASSKEPDGRFSGLRLLVIQTKLTEVRFFVCSICQHRDFLHHVREAGCSLDML